jgi:hypothetical protein
MKTMPVPCSYLRLPCPPAVTVVAATVGNVVSVVNVVVVAAAAVAAGTANAPAAATAALIFAWQSTLAPVLGAPTAKEQGISPWSARQDGIVGVLATVSVRRGKVQGVNAWF